MFQQLRAVKRRSTKPWQFCALALLLVSIQCSDPIIAFAARITGPVEVSESDLRSTNVTITLRGKSEQHEIVCIGNTAGAVRTRRSQLIFTSYGKKAKNLKRRGITSLRRTRFQRLSKVGNRACADLSQDEPPPPPGATPTPNLTPNATPQPTATPRPPNFDQNGNVTEHGKVVFGIPSYLSANKFTGDTLYQNTCADCHGGEQRGLFFNFQQLRNVTSGFPMFFTSETLPDQNLANITAYLNQGNP